MNKYLIGIIVVLILVVIFLFGRNNHLRTERNDFESALKVEQSKPKEWKDKNGLNHHQDDITEVQDKQVFKQMAKQEELLKILEGKLNKLESFRVTSTNSHYEVRTIIKDTIINSEHIKSFDYKDKEGFFEVQGSIQNDSIDLDIHTKDTIVAGVYKGKRIKKFLFIRYGRRINYVELVNKNPYSKIEYNKEVYLKKK